MRPPPREDWKAPGRFWQQIGRDLCWAHKTSNSISPGHRRWMVQNAHSHSYFEAAIGLEGAHNYGLDGEAWQVAPGCALFFASGVPHDSWYSRTHHQPCKDLWLHLLPQGHVHINVVEHRPPRKIQSSNLSVSDPALGEDLRRACALLYRELQPVGHPPAGAPGAFLMFVLHRLFEHLAAQGFQETPKDERHLLGQIKAHICGNLTDHLSLDDLARVAGYSPFHFHRIFAGVEGVTPRQFIEQERLRNARKLLLEGRTVTAAAFDSGFSSCSHFNRAFKKHFGVAPTAWLRGCSNSRPHSRRPPGRHAPTRRQPPKPAKFP